MKKIVIASMCIILALSLIACSQNNKTDETPVEKEDSDNKVVQIPNPMIEYETIDEAIKVLGFDFNALVAIPEDYELSNIFVIDKTLVEINYSNNDNEISLRAGQANYDISGNYNNYSQKKVLKISDNDVTIKSDNDKIYLVSWKIGDVSYSMTIKNGLNENDLINILKQL